MFFREAAVEAVLQVKSKQIKRINTSFNLFFCNSSIQKNPHSQPPYQAQLGLIGTVVQSENECACCVVDKSCVLQY